MESLRETIERLCAAFARQCERRATAAERRAASFDALATLLGAAESRAMRWELLDTAADRWEGYGGDAFLRPVPAHVPPTSNPDTMRLRAADERRIAAHYRAVASAIQEWSVGRRHLPCLRSVAGSLSTDEWVDALAPLAHGVLRAVADALGAGGSRTGAPAEGRADVRGGARAD